MFIPYISLTFRHHFSLQTLVECLLKWISFLDFYFVLVTASTHFEFFRYSSLSETKNKQIDCRSTAIIDITSAKTKIGKREYCWSCWWRKIIATAKKTYDCRVDDWKFGSSETSDNSFNHRKNLNKQPYFTITWKGPEINI